MSEKFLAQLGLRQRVLELLASQEEFGGPQSVEDVSINLGISNTNARSVLVRMLQAGKIERITKGIYRIKGDGRSYIENKPHYG